MPRRAGKAASRKARQRSGQRAARQAATPVPSKPEVVIPPVGTPDAREAASLDVPRRTAPRATAGGSTLTNQEKAEYHYVERDLRNIGILTAAMAALLFVAWLIFTATGLVG